MNDFVLQLAGLCWFGCAALAYAAIWLASHFDRRGTLQRANEAPLHTPETPQAILSSIGTWGRARPEHFAVPPMPETPARPPSSPAQQP